MKKPLLTTFVGSEETLLAAIEAGADHLILEDSKLAVRSYTDDFLMLGFEKIKTLACLARERKALINLSVNVDLMMHNKDFALLDILLHVLRSLNLWRVRVQDTGLISYLKDKDDRYVIDLATETSNNNIPSIEFYQNLGVNQQTLTNEMSKNNLYKVRNHLKEGSFEIQVQGPILLQYTHRRLMAGFHTQRGESEALPEQLETIMHKIAIDPTRKAQKFPFYDNPHGHLMYFWADRCLLKYIIDLVALGLDSWLVDARGESIDYLKESLRVYRLEMERYCSDPNSYQSVGVEVIEGLKNVAKRPFKAGFFLANRTDYVKRKRDAVQQRQIVAQVLDTIKGESFVVQVIHALREGQTYQIVTPEGRESSIVLTAMTNLLGVSLKEASAGALVKLPWVARVLVRSLILL